MSLIDLLALAKGGEYTNAELAEYEKERVKKSVDDYIEGISKDLVFGDMRKISLSFSILKEYLLLYKNNPHEARAVFVEDAPNVKNLKDQIVQRDAEIGISFVSSSTFDNI